MMNKRKEDATAGPSRDQLMKELADMKKQLSEDKARLEELRQSNRELDALTRVTDNVIKTLDIHEMVDTLLGRLVEVMNADAGKIVIMHDEKIEISSSIGAGMEKMPASEKLIKIILSTENPLYIEDAQKDPRVASPFIREHGIRTMLGVPLKYREKTIGALYLIWFKVHKENLRDIRLLEVTADRCAMAINNALMFERVQQARNELEGKVRERTAELSDMVRDLNLEADIRKKTESELKRARREIEFYFDLMGYDIGERDRAALRDLKKAFDKINAEGRLGKDDKQLLAEAMRNVEGSTQITRNINILRATIAERHTMKVIDLNVMLREVIDRFSRIPGRDITIRYNPSSYCEKLGCKVTATDLHNEIYENIIGNAIERSTVPLTINISLSDVGQDGER
jgi:hypothetical protein